MNVHRFLRTALLALLPAAQAPQLSQPVQASQTQGALASIRGVVLNAATNQPVPNAVVELTGIDQGRVVSHAEITGADGTFEILNLPPRNDYELVASDTGSYLPAAYGQHSLDEPWTPIALTPGQTLANVRLILTPLSSITGRILDEAGKPLSRADVYILRAAYSGGRRELQRIAVTQSNERGEYFWSGPGGGQYYIRANPSNGQDQQLFENPAAWDSSKSRKEGEPEGYPTAYYPRTMNPVSAKPVDLLNGGRAEGIDVTAPKMRTLRVGGTVLAITGTSSAPQPAAAARLLLIPREAGQESSLTRSTQANNSGQFDIRGVLPGIYNLYAIVSDEKSLLIARKSVEVASNGKPNARDSDLQKISLTATRGFDIPGSIHFEDWQGGAGPDYSQLAINLIPANSTDPIDRTSQGIRFAAAPLLLTPSSNGEFVMRNIVPGDYRIVLSLNPKRDAEIKVPLDVSTSYLKSARIGKDDILDNGLHIDGKPEGRIEITLAATSGSVFGRVLDENHEPVVPMRMVIVPDKGQRKRLDLFSMVSVTTTGLFSYDGIPPGDYKLFAWAHVEDGAWLDPEFIRVYEDRGTPIHIEESGAHLIDIPLLH